MRKFNKRSIMAGIFIGIGAFSNLYVNNKFLSPLLFSLGLISVILLHSNLYTGKIGYVSSLKEIKSCIIMCIINMISIALFALLTSSFIKEQAIYITDIKLSNSISDSSIKSILCGALIYIAVEMYKHTKNIICIILPVYVFIICGFDHCIANMYYFVASGCFSYKYVIKLIIYILGNAIGAIITNYFCKGDVINIENH